MQVFFDRRKARSNIAEEALSLQLTASATRAGAQSMVLADDHGLVIAHTGDAKDADELAAFSPYLASHHPWVGSIRCQNGQHQVAISPFALRNGRAYLCAVGGKTTRMGSAFLHATAGIRRILAP